MAKVTYILKACRQARPEEKNPGLVPTPYNKKKAKSEKCIVLSTGL